MPRRTLAKGTGSGLGRVKGVGQCVHKIVEYAGSHDRGISRTVERCLHFADNATGRALSTRTRSARNSASSTECVTRTVVICWRDHILCSSMFI